MSDEKRNPKGTGGGRGLGSVFGYTWEWDRCESPLCKRTPSDVIPKPDKGGPKVDPGDQEDDEQGKFSGPVTEDWSLARAAGRVEWTGPAGGVPRGLRNPRRV